MNERNAALRELAKRRGVLTEGDGVFAQKLRERGVPVYGESDIPRLLEEAGTAAFPNS